MALRKPLLFLSMAYSLCNANHRPLLPDFYDILDGPKRDGELNISDGGFWDSPSEAGKVVDVRSYGAKGNGTDSTQAFTMAWRDACASTAPAVLYVPKDLSFLLKPVGFYDPCKSHVTVQIQGTIVVSPSQMDWNGKNQKLWIEFNGISGLSVEGGGVINGNGEIWWKKSCKVDESQPWSDAPTAMTFHSCTNLQVEKLTFKNSQKVHVTFNHCNHVSVTISAPATIPNTDGIHVTSIQDIDINNCVISTGDDCISIVSGSQRVTIKNINCGPGHGISIGSLGQSKSEEYVSEVLVDTVYLHGTTNGARIKTWQGGHGFARNITFRNFNMNNVKNPIIIDQNYCDSKTKCKQQSSAVAVTNVYYRGIKGTCATDASLIFDCSKSVPCRDISLQDISLVKVGGKATYSICNNIINYSILGTVVPSCTISL